MNKPYDDHKLRDCVTSGKLDGSTTGKAMCTKAKTQLVTQVAHGIGVAIGVPSKPIDGAGVEISFTLWPGEEVFIKGINDPSRIYVLGENNVFWSLK